MHIPPLLADLGSFFGTDGLVLLVFGLLIFGRGLPEVGRNLYRTLTRFKALVVGDHAGNESVRVPDFLLLLAIVIVLFAIAWQVAQRI